MRIKRIAAAVAGLAAAAMGWGCVTGSYKGMLSWEQYDSRPRFEPYILELKCGQSQLLYYGAFHSVDLSHGQFRDIEKKWAALRPEVAMSEGGLWPLAGTREEAIRLYGEQGLLRFLANRDGVRLRCLDPSLVEQARFLSMKYSPSKIKIFFVLRQAAIERLRGWKGEDHAPIRAILEALTRWERLAGYPSSLAEVIAEARACFPELGAWEKIPSYYLTSPGPGSFLPEMYQAVNRFRDQQMLQEILGEMEKGRRVFALVGRSHVAIQEPVLLSELPGSEVSYPQFSAQSSQD